MRIQILLLLIFFCVLKHSSVFAQAQYFTKVFGPAQSNNTGVAVRQMADGSIFFAGNTDLVPGNKTDFSLVKMDSSANIIWTKTFGTEKDEFCSYMLITKSGGNIVMAGTSFENENKQNGLVIITDTAGNILKQDTIGKENTNTRLKFIQETKNNGYIICGSRSVAGSSNSNNDYYVAELDENLETLWEKTYGGSENDYAQMIRLTPDGGYIISGDSKSFNFDGRYENYIIKLGSSGKIEWETSVDGKFTAGNQSILVTSGNEYLITGEAIVDSSFRFDIIIAKINAEGKVKWKKFLGGSGTDAAFSAIETDSGKFLLTGYSNTYNPQKPIKIIIMEIDSAGKELTRNYYGDEVINIAYDIQRSVKNGYLVAGSAGNQFILIHSNRTGFAEIEEKTNNENWKSLEVFPNPAYRGSTVFISTTGFAGGNLKFSDISGKILIKEKLQNGQHSFQLPVNLSPGIYLIEFTATKTGKLYNSKLVITQ